MSNINTVTTDSETTCAAENSKPISDRKYVTIIAACTEAKEKNPPR